MFFRTFSCFQEWQSSSEPHQSDNGALGSELCGVEEVADEFVDTLVLWVPRKLLLRNHLFLRWVVVVVAVVVV